MSRTYASGRALRGLNVLRNQKARNRRLPRDAWFAKSAVFSQTSRPAVGVTKVCHFGLARQFASHHGNLALLEIFYTWDAALKWLGLRDISCPLQE
jgi:hypothetical protein